MPAPTTPKKLGSLKPKNEIKSDKLNPKQLDDEHCDDEHCNEHCDDHVNIDGDDNENVDDEVDVDEPQNDENNDADAPTGTLLLGRVKWFNDRRGYGYITCISPGSFAEQDIFVHHTNIRPQEKSYRTLNVNEYVQFRLGDADLCYDDDQNLVETDHQHQATDVTGVFGGPLLCDGPFRANNRRGQGFRGGSNRSRPGGPGGPDRTRDEGDYEEDMSRQRPRFNNSNNPNNSNNSNNSYGNRPRRRNDDDENWQSVRNNNRPVRRND